MLKKVTYSIKDILYNDKKKEFYICLRNGSIHVYSHSDQAAEFVIEESDSPLIKVVSNNDFSYLFCATLNNQFNVIGIPKRWLSEMTRTDSQINNFSIVNFTNGEDVTNGLNEVLTKEVVLDKIDNAQ